MPAWFAQYDQSILCPFQTCSFTLMRLHRSKPTSRTNWSNSTHHGQEYPSTKEDVGNALLQFVSMQFVYHVGHAWFSFSHDMVWSDQENGMIWTWKHEITCKLPSVAEKERPEPQRGWVLRQRLGCRANLFREFLVFFSIRIRCFVRFLHERITWKSVFVPKQWSRSRDQREEIYRVKEIVGSFDLAHDPRTAGASSTKNTDPKKYLLRYILCK